jgi:hypothetical protein
MSLKNDFNLTYPKKSCQYMAKSWNEKLVNLSKSLVRKKKFLIFLRSNMTMNAKMFL